MNIFSMIHIFWTWWTNFEYGKKVPRFQKMFVNLETEKKNGKYKKKSRKNWNKKQEKEKQFGKVPVISRTASAARGKHNKAQREHFFRLVVAQEMHQIFFVEERQSPWVPVLAEECVATMGAGRQNGGSGDRVRGRGGGR